VFSLVRQRQRLGIQHFGVLGPVGTELLGDLDHAMFPRVDRGHAHMVGQSAGASGRREGPDHRAGQANQDHARRQSGQSEISGLPPSRQLPQRGDPLRETGAAGAQQPWKRQRREQDPYCRRPQPTQTPQPQREQRLSPQTKNPSQQEPRQGSHREPAGHRPKNQFAQPESGGQHPDERQHGGHRPRADHRQHKKRCGGREAPRQEKTPSPNGEQHADARGGTHENQSPAPPRAPGSPHPPKTRRTRLSSWSLRVGLSPHGRLYTPKGAGVARGAVGGREAAPSVGAERIAVE